MRNNINNSKPLERETAVSERETGTQLQVPFAVKLQRTLRKVHMYLGLVLFPWVLLFGASGALYNHPKLGRDLEGRRVPPQQMLEATGFSGWSSQQLAQQVVDGLNVDNAASEERQRFRLDSESAPAFEGWALYSAPALDGGKNVLILDLNSGGAIAVKHPARPGEVEAPFARKTLALEGHSLAAVEKQLQSAVGTLPIDQPKALRNQVSPELRFRIVDAEGRKWNATYDLGTTKLGGRPADAPGRLLPVELLERLHRQHHFPGNLGATFWWAVFADLTGLTMVVWSLTGLAMWWQIRRARVVGGIAVAFAVVVAALVMTSTSRHLEWDPKLSSGPG